MNTTIAYGTERLELDLPPEARVTIVEPQFVPGLSDPAAELSDSLRAPIAAPPLRELAGPESRIGIIFSDITRATPYYLILPAILAELGDVPDDQITLFNATGTHRSNTPSELEAILGADALGRYRIVQNDCRDESSHRYVGTTRGGNRVEILSEFLDCDLRIATGFIEPHFFAGMSGGGKAIMPGLASLSTISHNHSAEHMDHPDCRWGVTHGNPLWEEVTQAARFAGETFLVNVAMNPNKEITSVFAGGFDEAHRRGCAYVKEHALAPIDDLYDIVVTSNSGHPLDLNMYQSVKGMSAASQIVRDGGHIVIAASCCDGIPDHGNYGALLAGSSSTAELLEKIRTPGFHEQDMWQAQFHALICEKATVHFYSDGLTDDQIVGAFMKPTHDVAATVSDLIASGVGTRVCVLPDGPLTIPYLS